MSWELLHTEMFLNYSVLMFSVYIEHFFQFLNFFRGEVLVGAATSSHGSVTLSVPSPEGSSHSSTLEQVLIQSGNGHKVYSSGSNGTHCPPPNQDNYSPPKVSWFVFVLLCYVKLLE